MQEKKRKQNWKKKRNKKTLKKKMKKLSKKKTLATVNFLRVLVYYLINKTQLMWIEDLGRRMNLLTLNYDLNDTLALWRGR
jgi:adenosyl cobinamide kinase/adenosyl cobinamide phosphate guanylyltransferase